MEDRKFLDEPHPSYSSVSRLFLCVNSRLHNSGPLPLLFRRNAAAFSFSPTLATPPLAFVYPPFCSREGPVYKLAFGPRSFIVVSDPVMAKHVLKSSVGDYDKGVLATVSMFFVRV